MYPGFAIAAMLAARRKDRQNLSKYASLISSPGNLATGFQLPANGTLFTSTTSVLAVADELVAVGDRVLTVAAGAANRKHSVGYFEAGKEVSKAPGAPGTVSLYVANGFGQPVLIGQG